MVILLTDRATAALEEMLLVNDAGRGEGVRLVPSAPGRIGLTIDTPQAGDEVIEHDEELLLIVDRSLIEKLEGSEIDCSTVVVEGQPYTEFTLRPAA